MDKTFKRTACNELEFNAWDSATDKIVTIARVYSDMESTEAYDHAITLVFDQAEKDVGRRLTFSHLCPKDEPLPSECIQSILVDMHGGQAKGIMKYFQDRRAINNPYEHLHGLVKVCHVHYIRSIDGERKSLKTNGVPDGNTLHTSLQHAICNEN